MTATMGKAPYIDGDEIRQKWHVGFIVLAYMTAFLGSYSAIRILEHGLWRSEKEKQNATLLSRYPLFSMAFVLGSCAIWSMHFVGMQAVELEGIDMCYNWLETICSLGLAVGGVWAGVIVASNDIFSGDNRFELLKHFIMDDSQLAKNHKLASRHVHMVAFFDMLHWIALGSLLAALGALSMHYVGMISMVGPFRREWSVLWVMASVLTGVVVCFAGFWILFRPLHWKVEKAWYRQASAAVIAAAVCFLHFLGMLSVTYIADSSQHIGDCNDESMMGWKPDQLQVLWVAMAVPLVAFCVEHTISSELRITYRELMDVQLSGSDFLPQNSQGEHGSHGVIEKEGKSKDIKDQSLLRSTWSDEVPGTFEKEVPSEIAASLSTLDLIQDSFNSKEPEMTGNDDLEDGKKNDLIQVL